MTRANWLVVRFVWEDVMHRPEYVAAVLGDVVDLRTSMQAVRRWAVDLREEQRANLVNRLRS